MSYNFFFLIKNHVLQLACVLSNINIINSASFFCTWQINVEMHSVSSPVIYNMMISSMCDYIDSAVV